MKKLITSVVLFCCIAFISCQENEKYNFAMYRVISLTSKSYYDKKPFYQDTVKFDFADKTQDQYFKEKEKYTFSKWVAPHDTIWFYKNFPSTSSCGNGKISKYFLNSDSTYEKMSEWGIHAYCK